MIKSIDFLKVILLILIPMLFFIHALFQLTPKTSVATNIKTSVATNIKTITAKNSQSNEVGK